MNLRSSVVWGVAFALAAGAFVQCARPCRPGTIFLTVEKSSDLVGLRDVQILLGRTDAAEKPSVIGQFLLGDHAETLEISIDDYAAGREYRIHAVSSTGEGKAITGSASVRATPQCSVASLRMEPERGTLSVLVGQAPGPSYADGPRLEARFVRPVSLAMGPDDSLYVGEDSGTIRRITPDGVVSTLAGAPFTSGATDGLGSEVRFTRIRGMTINGQKTHLAVVDEGAHSIRAIELATGRVFTSAGIPGVRGYLDAAPLGSLLDSPTGIAYFELIDSAVVLDSGNSAIRLLPNQGIMATANKPDLSDPHPPVPGYVNGALPYSLFRKPYDVVVSPTMSFLYLTDQENHAIRQITVMSVSTSTLAGSPPESPVPLRGFVDGVGAAARFNEPRGLAISADDILFVADTGNHSIRVVRPDGTVSTLAGTGAPGFVDGPAHSASFNAPYDVAVSSTGEVFVADTDNHVIRRIRSEGGARVVELYAGAYPLKGNTDGDFRSARFTEPKALCAAANSVWVSDWGNGVFRSLDLQAKRVTTLPSAVKYPADPDQLVRPVVDSEPVFSNACASNGLRLWRAATAVIAESDFDGGWQEGAAIGRSPAQDRYIAGLAFDALANQLYIADATGSVIHAMDVETHEFSILAGIFGQVGDADGDALEARFSVPVSLTMDTARRRLYVLEAAVHQIRMIDLASAPPRVSTLAGQRRSAGYVDGFAADARFNELMQVAVDDDGIIYATDFWNGAIRRIDPFFETVSTLVGGSGLPVVREGALSEASLSRPSGIVFVGSKTLLVSDLASHMIAKISLEP